MRFRFSLLLTLVAIGGAVCGTSACTAQVYDGCDCESCDGGCSGDCGYGNGYGWGRHGGGHGLHGMKGPCYYCCCCNSGCDLTCPCYGGCGCCDAGYMLPNRRAEWYNWNRNYAYTEYGQPTVLVTPPNVSLQTNYGWGVASSRISRVDHQFRRNYPGGGPNGGTFGGPFRPTPVWPSDTSQFGVYYVRGPW